MTAQQLSIILSGLKDEEVLIKFADNTTNKVVGVEIGTHENEGKIFLTLNTPISIYCKEMV